MQTIHYIVLGCCVWVLLGLFFWAQFHNSKGEQIDLDEPGSQGFVDQDGESTPGPNDWKHASVKVPHADASAATFHRPHVQD